jgi:ParB-like chromosome segregation protein Spo0J
MNAKELAVPAQSGALDGSDLEHDVGATELGGVLRVPVAKLRPGDSPRMSGQDEDHSQTLAEVQGTLPPILVHAETMRVIDGSHRVRAAMIAGETHVYARTFCGSEADAFVEAVRTNVTHGKPLTRMEREAAVRRILATHPSWSDRAIADVCAVSARTVAGLRRRASADGVQLNARVGRDGRARPIDASEGRRRAAAVLSRNPDASLREIAREANISPATARDVKARLRRGIDPLERRRKHLTPVPERQDPPVVVESDRRDDHLRVLRDDSSLQSAVSGLRCMQLFNDRYITSQDWSEVASELPLSRIYVVGDLARMCAKSWNDFADALHARSGRQ